MDKLLFFGPLTPSILLILVFFYGTTCTGPYHGVKKHVLNDVIHETDWTFPTKDGSIDQCAWVYQNMSDQWRADPMGFWLPFWDTKYFRTEKEAHDYVEQHWCQP